MNDDDKRRAAERMREKAEGDPKVMERAVAIAGANLASMREVQDRVREVLIEVETTPDEELYREAELGTRRCIELTKATIENHVEEYYPDESEVEPDTFDARERTALKFQLSNLEVLEQAIDEDSKASLKPFAVLVRAAFSAGMDYGKDEARKNHILERNEIVREANRLAEIYREPEAGEPLVYKQHLKKARISLLLERALQLLSRMGLTPEEEFDLAELNGRLLLAIDDDKSGPPNGLLSGAATLTRIIQSMQLARDFEENDGCNETETT